MGKVLIACEESQAVTIELRSMGVEAYSCDIVPASGGHPEWHIRRDVTELLQLEWDMVIAFPPCTHLAASGASHFPAKRADGRQQEGIDFFMRFASLNCPKVAIENPVGIMSTVWRKPDQIIQPYWFGDPHQKRTCLWLEGLPKLVPTNIVEKEPDIVMGNGRRMAKWVYETSRLGPSARGVARSKTFPGVAKAMATQWGGLL